MSCWTCWCAHKLVNLRSCFRVLVSALRQQGVAQGQQLHTWYDTCFAQAGKLGPLDLAFAITIMLALGVLAGMSHTFQQL